MEETCRGDTHLIVGLDADDPQCREYYKFAGIRNPHVVLSIRPEYRHQLVKYLNKLALERMDDYPILGHIGDDNVPRNVGWDTRVMESLDTHLFCYGDDLDPGRPAGSLALTIFMRSEVVQKLGYMGPPSIQHMYVDPTWFAWGKATSIEFLPDVVLEHMHYSLGKAPRDESYNHSTSLIPEDCNRYNAYCENGMNEDIEKLGGKPYTPEEMDAFNFSLNIPKRWA